MVNTGRIASGTEVNCDMTHNIFWILFDREL